MANLNFSRKATVADRKVVEKVGEVKGKGKTIVEAEKDLETKALKLKETKNKPNANWIIKVRVTNELNKVTMTGTLAEVQ